MVMSGIDGNSTSGMTPLRPPSSNANDEVSRGLEQQIQQKQKELTELKQDEAMSAEQKMKRRQELQKEISELQMQIRQHELDVRQKERQEQNAARQEKDNLATENGQMGYGKRTQGGVDMAISNVTTKSMLSAGSSIKMAKLQQGARKQAQGKANVLKAEIKQGGGSGKDVERKQKEVEAMEDKADKLESQQMSTLSDLNEQIRKDAREDQKVTQEEKAAEKKKAKKAAQKETEERRENNVQIEQNGETVESDEKKADGINETGMKMDGANTGDTNTDHAVADNHIDIVSENVAVKAASPAPTGVGDKVDVVI